jgi:flagellar biosynthesis/type III secretory pathway chaperone
MQRAHKLSNETLASDRVAEDVETLLDLMTELRGIIEAENDFLRRGMPAALSKLNDVKEVLSNRYAELSQSVLAAHADEIIGDTALCQQLLGAGQQLRQLTAENMQRLTAAMAATRARVDAVMAAVRVHDQAQQTYGRQGQANSSARSVSRTLQVYRGRPAGGVEV